MSAGNASSLIFRKASEVDFPALWALWVEVCEAGTAFMMRGDELDESVFRAEWFAPEAVVYLALFENETAGAYVVHPNRVGRGKHIANATYMVSEKWRGHGIGYQLGEHSLKIAKDLGFHAMQFNAVISTNESAVKLWQKLGFEIIGTVPQGFDHPSLGYVDYHIMYRFL